MVLSIMTLAIANHELAKGHFPGGFPDDEDGDERATPEQDGPEPLPCGATNERDEYCISGGHPTDGPRTGDQPWLARTGTPHVRTRTGRGVGQRRIRSQPPMIMTAAKPSRISGGCEAILSTMSPTAALIWPVTSPEPPLRPPTPVP